MEWNNVRISDQSCLIFVNLGSIEQDADIVAFLYRDDYYDRGGEEEEGIPNNKVGYYRENRSGLVERWN